MARLYTFPSVRCEDGALQSSWPRWLTRSQAAAYCRLTPARFDRLCPVEPTSGPSHQRDACFDRSALDAWIDGKGEFADWQTWLALMEGKAG